MTPVEDGPVGDRVVTDVAELKAISHPLRVRMLGALREHGPATAAELARRFHTDTGSTSYHLRILAKFGFVEEAREQRDGRERRWAASHRTTSWDPGTLSATEEGRAVVAVMQRRQVEALQRAVQEYEVLAVDPAWREVAGLTDLLVRLTPTSARRWQERVEALLDEFAAADADAEDAVAVNVFAAVFPAGSPSSPPAR